MGGTENITVLFTDLVRSTELASDLSAEAADELRRTHFAALRKGIDSSGGTEVKTLGDGLMVVFPTASAALSCAVAMQQAVEADSRRGGPSLGLRVGLSCGEATREADDYFGDPVVEAARLCARAEGGQILAASLVRALAGRRTAHVFRPLGELDLKGLSEPVETVEVGWQPRLDVAPAPGGVPLPSRLAIAPTIGVIGRDTEAALLADVLKRVGAGEGREVVLISGEAGQGKTTVAAQAARKAFDAGACVLLGRSDEDLGVPYGPFVEALHHYVTHGPEDVLRSHVQSHGTELARMIPALGQRLGDLPGAQSTDPDAERYLLFGAVVRLLGEASASEPLVLVLDDLQWADKPTLQLLRHLVTSADPMRVLVIGTYRDSELSRGHPLTETLAALRREPGVSRIELKGLDDTGVIAFMEAAAGHGLDDIGVGLAHAVYRETDGNPFFVGEVLRHLSETGAIYQDDSGRWTATADLEAIALPDSVREVVAARVSRLGESARHVLSFASVIGRDFDVELLGRVSGGSEYELLDTLDGATAAALVREISDVPGHYSFSHALVQHTLYQDMGPTRRALAHRQVAQALEAICGERPADRVGELAHHWSNATQPVDSAKAIGYARQAAEAALRALAPDDAVRYFSQAFGFFEQQRDSDPLMGVDLLLGLGNAQRQAGIPAFRETLLSAARQAQELGATDRVVAAALANNRGFNELGVIDADKVAILEAALASMADDDSPERALLLAGLCNELAHGPLTQRRTLAEEAKAMARRLGDPATTIQVLNIVNQTALLVPALHQDRVRESAEGLTLAEGLGDPVLLFWAANVGHICAAQSGDFDRDNECFATTKALSERLRQPMLVWVATFHEAAGALLVGEPDRAEELATLALQVGTDSGQPDAFAYYGAQLIMIRLQQGRMGELISLVAQVADENPSVAGYRAALAEAHLEAGDDVEARQLLDAAAEDGFGFVLVDVAWMDTVAIYARVAIELEVRDAAELLFGLLAPYDAQIPFTGLLPHPPVASHLGGLASVLGRYDEAESYFAQADELNTRGNMKFAEVYSQLLWGRMLTARDAPGDVARARPLFEQARATAATKGYAMIERRAVGALSTLA